MINNLEWFLVGMGAGVSLAVVLIQVKIGRWWR